MLKSIGLYHRVKASSAYDFYWRFVDPRLIHDREKEIAFYRKTLQGFATGDLIFDIGANRGHKTHVFLRLGASVVAVEPDVQNQTVLRESFLRYRRSKKPVKIVDRAVSDHGGSAAMWVEAPGSAKNTLSAKWVDSLQSDASRFGHELHFNDKVEVETVTLDNLIANHGSPFYIKIDVEGHEAAVLRGLHSRIPYLSFEVNLPEFVAEAVECTQWLAKLSSGSRFNYTSNCAELLLKEWVDAKDIVAQLETCRESSVEVFCRS